MAKFWPITQNLKNKIFFGKLREDFYKSEQYLELNVLLHIFATCIPEKNTREHQMSRRFEKHNRKKTIFSTNCTIFSRFFTTASESNKSISFVLTLSISTTRQFQRVKKN